MKFLALALLLGVGMNASAQTSCGGRSGPCPSTVPAWNGTYAPGYGPNSGNVDLGPSRTCGGRAGPCASTAPGYKGCQEGTYATVAQWPTGVRTGRTEGFSSGRLVCHHNRWVNAN